MTWLILSKKLYKELNLNYISFILITFQVPVNSSGENLLTNRISTAMVITPNFVSLLEKFANVLRLSWPSRSTIYTYQKKVIEFN